jgi:hypothetical protein
MTVRQISSPDASIAEFEVVCEYEDGFKYTGVIKGVARTRSHYHLLQRACEIVEAMIQEDIDKRKVKAAEVIPSGPTCDAKWAIEGATWSKPCSELALPNSNRCADHKE